jgi:hypothetical protein
MNTEPAEVTARGCSHPKPGVSPAVIRWLYIGFAVEALVAFLVLKACS